MNVVTRYAPSPTGMPHLGGTRTALYNYLFAKHHGGKFLLRIEDTDRKRSTKEAEKAIIESLSWLGINHDDSIVYQSTRTELYQQQVAGMLQRGTAFKCYETLENLQNRRNEGLAKRDRSKNPNLSDDEREQLLVEADKLLSPYRSPWRDSDRTQPPNTPYTVRVRAPDEGTIEINDTVHGTVSVNANEVDDLILLRADQTPTYLLAVVVDEVDMGITHIIRGDDHLLNTARQSVIYDGLGWNLPSVTHLPLIHGPDGRKLSKRDQATNVLDYRERGYLPEALVSYLTRLGWSHGNQEIFSMDEAVSFFDIAGVHKSPARLDLDKLNSVNAHFLRSTETHELMELVKPYILPKESLDEVKEQRVCSALPVVKERASTLPQLAEALSFLLVDRPIELNKKAKKTVQKAGAERLSIIQENLGKIVDWNENSVQEGLNFLCSSQDLTIGEIGSPIRAAVTGGLPAPDLSLVLNWLGREEVLLRIQDQLSTLRN